MIFTFTSHYKSGREEIITTKSSVKAKEVRKDLARAKDCGAILDFSEKVSDERVRPSVESRKVGTSVMLQPDTHMKLLHKAAQKGVSYSSYMREVAEEAAK